MTHRVAVTWLIALTLLVPACGGSPAEPDPQPDTGGEAAALTWDDMDVPTLAAYVRDGSQARIHEIEPDLPVDALPGWAADPDSAPSLGDRVSEQVIQLAIAALALDELDLAEGLIRLVRAKARNRNNAFAGNTLLSEIARRRAADRPEEAVRDVFAELPRNRFGGATVLFQLFQDEGQVDARVAQVRGQLLSLDTATTALFYDAVLRPIVQNRGAFMAGIAAVRETHDAVDEPPAYDFSTVDLSGAEGVEGPLVAVWDTGVAGDLFESQLFDADGVHGVVSDPTEGQTGLTYEPGEAVITEYAPFLRGIMDLRAGLASTEAAQRVLTLMRGAQDEAALENLEQNLDAVGEWAHGTHVAGIMLAGVPQARLAVFRSAWAGEARVYHHRGPTDAELAAERENVEAIAAFINQHNVRVVNASLGFGRDYVENMLRHESDTYSTDAEVRARAAEVHQHRAANWRYVFEQCPNTLFVVAAGNSNRDIVEYEDVPASLEGLPNLLVVGAVDRFGNWATFTNSNPDRVQVFDHGVEVDSVIPNGERVPLSGTSMASPNVANLATKMIAVAPALTPPQVISMIREHGDAIEAPFYGVIANEEAALEAARGADAD